MATPILICVNPDKETQVTIEPKVATNSFDDTYEQSMGLGAFNSPVSMDLKWSNAKYAEAIVILAFLKARRGYQKFLYAAPEEPQRLFKCPNHTYKWKAGRRCDIRATFNEQAG